MLFKNAQSYLLFGIAVSLYGLDNQITRWGSQRINWFKVSALRYGVRGVVAAVSTLLLMTCVKNNFKDPPTTTTESVHAWRYESVVCVLAVMALVVCVAGYAAMYLISQTTIPTVLSACLSVGSMLVALVMGRAFFNEQITSLQGCGIGLAIISVVLMGVGTTDKEAAVAVPALVETETVRALMLNKQLK